MISSVLMRGIFIMPRKPTNPVKNERKTEEQSLDNAPACALDMDFSKNNSLTTIYQAALLLGIPVTPSILNPNIGHVGWFHYVVCWVFFLVRLLIYYFGGLHMHHYVITRSYNSVFHSFTICGLLLQLFFLFKERKIIASIRDICMLCREYKKDCRLGERNPVLKGVFFISLTLFMALVQFNFMNLRPIEVVTDSTEDYTEFDLKVENIKLIAVRFIIIFSNATTILIILTTAMLCSDVFRIMSDAVSYYRQKFTKDLKSGVLKREKCTYYTVQFHAIVSKFKDLNDSISEVVACFYAFMLFSLLEITRYCVGALMINESFLDNSFGSAAAIISIFVLLYLSLNGSDIYENGEKLKSTKFPGEIPKKAVNVKALFDDIKQSTIGVHIWRSFHIRRNILAIMVISGCFYALYYRFGYGLLD